ncbi:MAG: plastocyanin/azurin family copper-binding protein [Chloroflexi bacterium]|nr:plastocyanin/azurin family copper-binding protein [Chloroflexota bacterium]
MFRTLVALAAALALVACADPGVPAPKDVPPDAPFVSQDRLTFSPKELQVQVGERIYFYNGETAVHNLVFDKSARSPDMEAGDIFVWSFSTPGEHVVTCDYHPQMRLRVTVLP